MSKDLRITDDDHVRGSEDAAVTLIEYADFQCPYCARAHAALEELQRRHGARVALVFRHLPLRDLHPFAQAAAEAAEAAGAQGKFWEMHDALFAQQASVSEDGLPDLAARLGLDVERFTSACADGRHRARIDADVEDAHAHGARGTPTFFINGERYHGDSDHASLAAAIEDALGAR